MAELCFLGTQLIVPPKILRIIAFRIKQIVNDKTDLNQFNQKSMQDSAVQVRRSLGRTSYATTHSEALQQAKMPEQAKQSQRIGK